MKCKNCGSNLTIDDEVCSFCGNANPFAAKHRAEMRYFTKEFNETKEEVLKQSGSLNKWAVKITMIAVLIALNCLVMCAIMYSYEIENFIINRHVIAHYNTYKSTLDELEENRNYIGFYEYYDENSLYRLDVFEEYKSVYYICNNYVNVYRNTLSVVTEEEGESEYDSYERKIESISDAMESAYYYCNPREYSNMEEYSTKHQACMDDAIAQMEDLIQVYFNISDGDMERFPELSTARRQVLMEEGIGINE